MSRGRSHNEPRRHGVLGEDVRAEPVLSHLPFRRNLATALRSLVSRIRSYLVAADRIDDGPRCLRGTALFEEEIPAPSLRRIFNTFRN